MDKEIIRQALIEIQEMLAKLGEGRLYSPCLKIESGRITLTDSDEDEIGNGVGVYEYLKAAVDKKLALIAKYGNDGNGLPTNFHNFYRCEACDEEWEGWWSCGCDEACPNCDKDFEPYKTEVEEE